MLLRWKDLYTGNGTGVLFSCFISYIFFKLSLVPYYFTFIVTVTVLVALL